MSVEARGEAAGGAPRRGALWVPDWPIVAAIVEGDLPAHLPSALCRGRVVIAVSAQGRRCGIRPGMTCRTAQSLVPDLVCAPADEAQQARAFEPVMHAVTEVVADATLLRPGLALLGIEGAARYYGTEEEVAQVLVGATGAVGVEAQVGAGPGFLTTILAARASAFIPEGGAAQFLEPKPITALLHAATTERMREEYRELIGLWRRLGLQRLGQVAALSPSDVLGRFGQVGVRAHRLAQGRDVRVRAGQRTAGDLSTGRDLDPPATTLDAAAFVAQGLAQDLHDGLAQRGLACENLRVFARAENGAEHSRTWRVEGLLGVEELTDRVRWQLAGWLDGRSGQTPSAPLVRIDLTAEGNYPLGAGQKGLWGEVGRKESQARRAAERVQGLLGAEGVVSPVEQGGRTPRERIRLVAWGDEPIAGRNPDDPWAGQLPEPLPTTMFTPPIALEISGSRGAVRMTRRGGLTCDPEKVRVGERVHFIQGWAGPWPIHGRWWEGQVPKVYLQIVTSAGAWLVSGGADGWEAEGVYD